MSKTDLISGRKARLNAQITGKTSSDTLKHITRESLLDTFQTLYEECSNVELQRNDPKIAQFCEKYRDTVLELRKVRVNVQDFEILATIGRGQFGEVHAVRERSTGELWAMKSGRKSEAGHFDAERDIMALSRSPFLTSLQYAFQDQTYLFYVMEYHPGGDLLALLYRQGGTLPESAVTFYIAELILALDDLHGMGFVHRDLKPDNVLLDRCGHVKLADFGSATRLNSQGCVTSSTPVGTPDYVAPEVLKSLEQKNPGSYGVSCDYWSLGVLAYELSIGKTPFCAPNTAATFAKIMTHTQHLRFPQDCCLTQAFVNLVKCLLTDVKKRLDGRNVRKHALFKHVHFESLREQVPPFVPKLASAEDTSNFGEVPPRKNAPSMENYKKKTQFSGRNLPFIGFSYVHEFAAHAQNGSSDSSDDSSFSMQPELRRHTREQLKVHEERRGEWEAEKVALAERLLERGRKVEMLEELRDTLEKELSMSAAQCTALKRTIQLERKDRAELEQKTLERVRAAKLEWDAAERTRIAALTLEIEQQNARIATLSKTNATLNEQLSKALFTQEKRHKEALEKEAREKVHKLSRRSVIGLESRLEQMTTQNQDAMLALKALLQENNREKVTLEEEVRRVRNNETRLLEQLKATQNKYDNLKQTVDNSEQIITELATRIGLLETETESSEQLKVQLSNEQQKCVELSRDNDRLQRHNTRLTGDVDRLTGSVDRLTGDIDALTRAKQVLERNVGQLESRLQQSDDKCASLLKQLNAAAECEQLKEMRVKQWKIEKELENCQIDKRILERELKDAEKQLNATQDKMAAIENNMAAAQKRHEETLNELNALNKSLTGQLARIAENCKLLETRLEKEKDRGLSDRSEMGTLKATIREKDAALEQLKGELADLTRKIDLFEANKSESERTMERVRGENVALKEEVSRLKETHNHLKLNFDALREACVLLENQVVEYEQLNGAMHQERVKLTTHTEHHIEEAARAREQTQEARKALNAEKSLRLLAEAKIKRLENDLNQIESELATTKIQCGKYRECLDQLNDELAVAEQKNGALDVELNARQRHVDSLNGELRDLKEELSQCLTQLTAVKETNYKYRAQLEDVREQNGELRVRLTDLERQHETKMAFYEEREVKKESTIRQQTKLIDYLQVKIEEQNNKKKSFADKLFGHSKKENQPPSHMTNHHTKDLLNELQREKEANKALKRQIVELQGGGKKGHCNVDNKKGNCHVDNQKGNCNADNQKGNCNADKKAAVLGELVLEGWIKVLSKSKCWERRYAQLHRNAFKLYDRPEKQGGTLLETVWISPVNSVTDDIPSNLYNPSNLNGCHDHLTLEPLPSEIGVSVANSDQQFIAMIEREMENGVGGFEKKVVLMTLSSGERDAWFRALQDVFNESSTNAMDVICELPNNDVTVHCVLELSKQLKVLACDSGLISIQNASNTLVRINGPNDVTNMATLRGNVLLIAAGSLLWCELSHFTNVCQSAECTRPTLITHSLFSTFNDFCYLATSQRCHDNGAMFCVATEKQLLVASYDPEAKTFNCLRLLDTAQPTCSALFTDQSLLVCTDKVFEIELETMETGEFLDENDVRLSHVCKFTHRRRSYPMSVLQIAVSPQQYFVGFKETAVVVDESGRCCRDNDVKPGCLPTGYYFIDPYLYISHAGGCEIVKMRQLDGTATGNFPMDGLKVLGSNRKGLFVAGQNKILLLEGKKIGDFDDLDSVTTPSSGDTTSSDRFSFSSSMVQSLDGHMSDSEEGSKSSDSNNRKVKFLTTTTDL